MRRTYKASYLHCLLILTMVATVGTIAVAEVKPEQLVEKYGRAVVLITAKREDGKEKQGTGYLVTSNGALVTNLHVIHGAITARVKLTTGDVYDQVEVVDHDARRDLAVLKIKGFKLPTVDLGDSDNVRVGERVYVIGNPRGLENTISEGLLSGTRDTGEGYRLIQISAAISPGSSGSPVFNSEGKVIGTAVSQLINGQNLNFAVPVNYAQGMISDKVKSSLRELAGKPGVLKPSSPGSLKSFEGHRHNVVALSWSPDSQKLASGSVDTTIKIWEVSAGKELHTIRHHVDMITDVAWSPDGAYIASTSRDKTLRLLNPTDGTEVRTLMVSRDSGLNGAGWSPDSKLVAVGSNLRSYVLHANSGKKARGLDHESLYARMSFSPDGRYIGSAGLTSNIYSQRVSGVVIVRETKGGWDRKLNISNLPTAQWDFAWSPDGSKAATCGKDGIVRLWDMKLRRAGRVFYGHEKEVQSITWSPNGKYLASGGVDGRVIIWESESGEQKKVVLDSGPKVFKVAWSPNGKWLAIGSGSLYLFEVKGLE